MIVISSMSLCNCVHVCVCVRASVRGFVCVCVCVCVYVKMVGGGGTDLSPVIFSRWWSAVGRKHEMGTRATDLTFNVFDHLSRALVYTEILLTVSHLIGGACCL